MTVETITATEITDPEERLKFLPKNVGQHFMKYETLVYNLAGKFCQDYNGGFWNMYQLDNGGFYMAPSEGHHASFDNYFEANLDADTLGIVISLYATNWLCGILMDEKLSDAYYQLRDYALNHENAAQIMRAID